MGKQLKRDVYLDGNLLAAGTKLTDQQAERITNPKAFEDAADVTGPDADDTRAYRAALAAGDKPAEKPAGQDTEDRAAAGAKLARGARPAASTAPKVAGE